jgi:hypothetical protein
LEKGREFKKNKENIKHYYHIIKLFLKIFFCPEYCRAVCKNSL